MNLRKIIRCITTIFLYISLPIYGAPVEFKRKLSCKVVGIRDGDSLICLHENKQIEVRLAYIDAPETHQAYANQAKQTLSQLVFKKIVTLHGIGYDKYQRLLAVVYDERKENVNLRLVKQGMAWAYQQTQPLYQTAQQEAQYYKIGLWQDKSPINPADWRANKRSNADKNLQKFPQNRPLVTVNCQVKLSCNKIGDYEAAKHYFKQCGWKELDGNNDGIPCNKLYRQAQKQ